jgi:gluconolactonase
MRFVKLRRVAVNLSTVMGLLVSPLLASGQESLSTFCGECRAEKVATCGGFLEGASVDPSGRLWVLDIPGGRVINVTDDGQCVVKGKTGGGPAGSKFTKDGRMFITDGKLGLINFDPSTSKVTVVADTFEGTSLATANDLAIDAHGGIYFTVPSGSDVLNRVGRVFYLGPNTKTLRLITDKIAYPNGITISPDGQTILVAEFAAQRVLTLPAVDTTAAHPLTNIYANTRGGVGPDGIMMDSKGHLLTANLGTGEVLVFTADGRLMGGIQLPDDAGKTVTNLVIRGRDLYVTAGPAVWRVRLNN